MKRLFRTHYGALSVVAAMPVIASAFFLLHFADNDPAGLWSFLTTISKPSILPGPPGYWDASIGLLTQPLARLSAFDWLHGIVPWWNPYTGIGMPLAAEMQTMAFFLPFVLIMKFWQGWFVVKLLMQIIAGIGTYALMLQLGCRRTPAVVSASLFALNGAFLMEPHAMGSLAMLPLILLGIERSAAAARAGAAQGWNLIVVGLAYSLYGGYPEVAYLDGMLAVVWTLSRFASLGRCRWRFAVKIIVATALGIGLALPLIVPFFHYVAHSYFGLHKHFYANSSVNRATMPLALFPLIYGVTGTTWPAGMTVHQHLAVQWVQLGGWFGLTAAIPALLALTQMRSGPDRGLIIGLCTFLTIGLARCYGFPGVADVVNAIVPYLPRVNTARFLWPALSMAVFILTGIGLERANSHGRRVIVLWTILVVGVVLGVLIPNRVIIAAWYAHSPLKVRWLVLLGTGFECLAGLIIGLSLIRPVSRLSQRLSACLILLDALIVAALPQLSAPTQYHYQTGGIRFLKANLGTARFYTIRPFGPDYPAGYRLASVDDSQLPVSRGWNDYIVKKFDKNESAMMFVGWWNHNDGSEGLPALRRNLLNYEATGVKYVIADPGTDLFRADLAVPDHGRPAGAAVLVVNQSLKATLPEAATRILQAKHRPIDRIAILIGTFDGRSRGSLDARLCEGPICASGSALLDHARDNALLPIRLSPTLTITAHQTVTLRLTHRQGSGAVAVWLRRTASGATLPQLTIGNDHQSQHTRLVYHDQVMAIYQLPRHRAFFTASPACRLTPYDLNKLDTICSSHARLTRLEAWFPGWHVTINGHPASIQRASAVFQSISVPPGHSRIRFFYRPRDTRLSVSLAVLALIMWAGGAIRLRLRSPRDLAEVAY